MMIKFSINELRKVIKIFGVSSFLTGGLCSIGNEWVFSGDIQRAREYFFAYHKEDIINMLLSNKTEQEKVDFLNSMANYDIDENFNKIKVVEFTL